MKLRESARRSANRRLPTLSNGESHLDRREYDLAIRIAKSTLAIDPNHLGGLELLARSYWRSERYEESLDALRHLIRLNPYEPGYHYLKAMALQGLGHYGEAVRSFSRCMTSDAGSLSASAAVSIQDLEAWQEDVIAELLRSDSFFKSQYEANPIAACSARGFAFTSGDDASGPRAGMSDYRSTTVWCRPS